MANPSNSVAPAALIGSTPHGAFTNAHHFTIGHLTTIEYLDASNSAHREPVLKYLLERGKPAAIHDSSARAYPPLCHPDTRKTLRGRVIRWGMGNGNERILWIFGPAAVGKSAVAQTVAEEFKRAGRLGASFFFSRPNHLDNPDWVIPTIVYQLATQNGEYKRIVTQCLVDDILILDKNRSTQFRELIIEPFRILMTQYPHTVREPLLIVLDGLDECKDKEAQCEFIDLINTHTRQIPLRWMICSRPDWRLMTMLSNPDFMVICRREELNICDDEAQRDVQCLLEAEFDKIRQEYKDRLPVDWPPEYQQRRIASIASGHLGFASFILRFIGDKECDDPDGQLKVCMMFLKGGHTVGPISPLRALDDLYCQVLSGVPAKILSTTMRILGLVITDRHGLDSADDQAGFLGLDQVTFRRALQNLHSVVYVPPIEESNTTLLHIYHASFADFLGDVRRSGEFHLNREAAKYDFALQCLHWIENAGKK
ncbi:hypothetical protein P691DRAFT_739000 [Macrolepiota fuliginosa MF-IS2]|uniref:Nephrocystin 3-like N-terminal domain-containing protein n=1 Tax=Macrolepiota fuliginosa MF-IS2 TaxID=1400762 RepID=A0A9P5X2Z9_9AGAR|nr:hypothetical protein P691DRAFT_739000 [Macrolepiota fuliginosa MF-IS2]